MNNAQWALLFIEGINILLVIFRLSCGFPTKTGKYIQLVSDREKMEPKRR